MKIPQSTLVLALIALSGGTCSAETLRLVNPVTLNTELTRSLSNSDKQAVAASFQKLQGTTHNVRRANSLLPVEVRAMVHSKAVAGAPTISDPVTGIKVNVDAFVATSLALQKAWFAKTGQNLKPDQTLDLNILTGTPPATGNAATPAPMPPGPAPPNAGNGTCPPPANPNDLTGAWSATTSFVQKPDDSKICSLPYGGLIEQVAASPKNPLLPAFDPSFQRSFGDAATAQGTFYFTPKIDTSNPSNVLDASLDLGFSVLFLNGKVPKISVLDGKADVSVPYTGKAKATVSVTGAAFPDNALFSSQTAVDGSFSYDGTPSKSFTFFEYAHTYPVPGPILGIPIDINVDAKVTGQTSLHYDVSGGADGLFATAKPNVMAQASATAGASFVLTGVDMTGAVTVQNSNSSFVGLLTVVPYAGSKYSVERIRADYEPSQYEATIIVTGYCPILFWHWKVTVMDTGLKPIDVKPYAEDSQWAVQQVQAAKE